MTEQNMYDIMEYNKELLARVKELEDLLDLVEVEAAPPMSSTSGVLDK